MPARDPRYPMPPPKVVYRCVLGPLDCMCDASDATTQFCVNMRRIELDIDADNEDQHSHSFGCRDATWWL